MSLKIVAAALALSVLAGTSLFAQEQTPPPEQSEGRPSSSPDSSAQGSGDPGAPRSIRVGGNVAAANLHIPSNAPLPRRPISAVRSSFMPLSARMVPYKNCNISRGRRC